MRHRYPKHVLDRLQAELDELDRENVEVDGVSMKPSQCYHLDTDPAHILFNTNCPDTVRQKVKAILEKYTFL